MWNVSEPIIVKSGLRDFSWLDFRYDRYFQSWSILWNLPDGIELKNLLNDLIRIYEASFVDYLNELKNLLETEGALTPENLYAVLTLLQYEPNLNVIKACLPKLSIINTSINILQNSKLSNRQNIQKMITDEYNFLDAFPVMLNLMKTANALEQRYFDELLNNGPYFRKLWYNELESPIRNQCFDLDVDFNAIDFASYVTPENLKRAFIQAKLQFCNDQQLAVPMSQDIQAPLEPCINQILRFKNLVELNEYRRRHPDFKVPEKQWNNLFQYYRAVCQMCSIDNLGSTVSPERAFYEILMRCGRDDLHTHFRDFILNEKFKKSALPGYEGMMLVISCAVLPLIFFYSAQPIGFACGYLGLILLPRVYFFLKNVVDSFRGVGELIEADRPASSLYYMVRG